MQLMIYVGGTLVLLIFGVMLTAQARFISMKTSARRMGRWLRSSAAHCCGCCSCRRSASSRGTQPRTDLDQLTIADTQTSTPIGLALAGVRVDKLEQTNERLTQGMSGYLLSVRDHLDALAGRADWRGLHGPHASAPRTGALPRAAAATPRVRQPSVRGRRWPAFGHRRQPGPGRALFGLVFQSRCRRGRETGDDRRFLDKSRPTSSPRPTGFASRSASCFSSTCSCWSSFSSGRGGA